MIVLDTNVLSALMLRVPDAKVVAWLDTVPAESVWTTAMTVFEIRFALALLQPGRRRKQLEDAFTRALEDELEHRILPPIRVLPNPRRHFPPNVSVQDNVLKSARFL